MFFRVSNMHVLNTNGATIRFAQDRQQVAKFLTVYATNTTGKKRTLEIPNGEPVG